MFPSFEPNYIEDSIAKFHASSCSQAKAKVGGQFCPPHPPTPPFKNEIQKAHPE